MKKNKEKIFEIIRYLIVGVLTTVVSLVVYYGLSKTVLNPENPIELQIANIISWIISVLFAYITNRIFVFKSQNKSKGKEFLSFVGSRIITLLMDMTIMFGGVTFLKWNDKLVKLASQGIVIVANYIFSKLFVFQEKKHQKSEKKAEKHMLNFSLLFGPILYFLEGLFPSNFIMWTSIIFLGITFLAMIIILLSQNKHWQMLWIIGGYLILQILYIYCQNLDLQQETFFLIQTFLFPISLFYFYESKEEESEKFITKVFFLYLCLFLIPVTFGFFQNTDSKNTLVGILSALLPVVLKKLRNHHNKIAKSIGLFLIFSAIILWNSWLMALSLILSTGYLLRKEKQNNQIQKRFMMLLGILSVIGIVYTCQSIILNKETTLESFLMENNQQILEENKNKLKTANIDEQLFGIAPIQEIEVQKSHIDLSDILFRTGVIGFLVYLGIMGGTLAYIKMDSYKKLGFLLAIFASFFKGSLLTNGYALIALSLLATKKDIEKKKILLVSNMYPSRKHKHYGSFVKNTSLSLEALGFQVDKVTKKKQITFPGKFMGYSLMYLKAIYKSIFYSYDYIYVHFIAQSTFCVLLGRITSENTKLVLNVHGNDIVPDYEFEQKNVRRSKFVLPYADIIIAPSDYFKEVLEKNYNIADEKIKIYPSGGINRKIFYPINKQECKKILQLEEDKIYYGYVSRIEKDKGWDTLLNTLNSLNKENALKNIKIIIIGTGSEQKEFQSIVTKYHLEDKIIQRKFVYQSDLINYYNAMDLFIFPTKRKSESLGLVGLEAMACKTFVIGCTLYGPKEYLKNRETALTYTKDEDLKKKIKEFQKMSSKEKEKIIEKAYQTVEYYDQERLVAKLKKIFS